MKPSEQKSDTTDGLTKGRKYIIAGGTGFIGRALSDYLITCGNEVVILTRGSSVSGSPRLVQWDGITVGPWKSELEGAFAIVNLAGRSIDARHTPEIRKEILESRIQSVALLHEALSQIKTTPIVWVQASAIGIYGNRSKEELDESARPGKGILADVTERWEKEFAKVTGIRKVTARFGVVLGHGEGAFPKLEKLTKLFLGGTAGSGQQYVSWIHLQDLVRALEFVAQGGQGTYNFTAPEPVTNSELMTALRRAAGRPWSPPVPAFALKLGAIIMKTQPELILESTRAIPKKLCAEGFQFNFPTLPEALKNLVVSG